MSELVIYPTHTHVAEHEAQIALSSDDGLCLGRRALSIRSFEDLLARTALPEAVWLTQLEERMLLRWVGSRLAGADGRLRLIGGAGMAAGHGFVETLGKALGACRHADVGAAELERTAKRLGDRGSVGAAERVRSVARLLREFDAAAGAAGRLDRGRALSLAARAIRDAAALPAVVAGAERIVVRYVHELPPARVELLDAVAARIAPERELVIELPHRVGSSSWFAATDRLLDRLEARGEAAALTVMAVDPCEGPALGARGARALCSERPEADSQLGLQVVAAPDRASERREVARIVRSALDAGTPPERVLIATRHVDRYEPALVDALTEAGVPVFGRRGTPLSRTAPIRWLVDLITCARDGFGSSALSRVLSSAYAAPLLQRHGLLPTSASRILRGVGIRPQPDEGSAAVAAALDSLAQARDAPRGSEALRDLVAELGERTRPIVAANNLDELVSATARLVAWTSLSTAASRLSDDGAKALVALASEATDPIARAEAEGLGRDQDAMDALAAALSELQQAARCLGFDRSDELASDVLFALLADALADESVRSGGLRGGAVRIVALRDAVGLPADMLCVVGLTDTEIPAPNDEGAFFTLADRLSVARLLSKRRFTFDVAEDTVGGPVAFPTTREAEPLSFLLSLTAAGRQLLLTRPRADDAGRPLPQSPYLADLVTAVGAAGGRVDHYEPPIAPATSLQRAAGRSDVARSAVVSLASVAAGSSASSAARHCPEGPGGPLSEELGLPPIFERIRIERRRLSAMLSGGEGEDAHGGHVGREASAWLTRRGERPWSATAFEDLTSCPFKFFVRRVLSLGVDQEASDDLDRMRAGILAHEVLQAVMEALVTEGVVPYRIDLAQRAEQLARRVGSDAADKAFSAVPRDAAVVALSKRQTVERVAALVRALYEADDGYAPVVSEQRFGGKGGWPALQVNADGASLSFHGRIDLVERLTSEEGTTLRVVDLKSGGISGLNGRLSAARVGRTDLQLPIYAAAARAADGATTCVDARYLSLRDAAATPTVRQRHQAGRGSYRDDERRAVDLLDVVDEAGRPTVLAEHLVGLHREIERGRFGVTPARDACDRCDLKPVCRVPRGAQEGDAPS